MNHPRKQNNPVPDFDTLLSKLETYCAYQERCIKEVKDKLQKLGANKKDYPAILHKLQVDNYLNEQRFALSFVKGKFRHNKWGKIKLRFELIKKGIPEPIINKALSEIEKNVYFETFQKLISSKSKELNLNNIKDKEKLFRFLLTKGYESDFIREYLSEQ